MREMTKAPPLRASRMMQEVADGLRKPQKELPPKYFYDALGSLLFDEITRLPEYYLTRIESRLLDSFGRNWLAEQKPASLVELGAGSGEKTRILLDALSAGAWYVPVDLSPSYLEALASDLGAEYPQLVVRPSRCDITRSLDLPPGLPRPTVIAFLGSTIGNFDGESAIQLLRRVSAELNEGDRFLIGVDLDKDVRMLEAAYNDSRGITAAFNLNILRVLNRELGTNFNLDAFAHRAFYDRSEKRIEMHLVAESPQAIHVPQLGTLLMTAGESIRTEISCKYDRPSIERLFAASGLELEHWITDPGSLYALVTGRPCR
jgi:L-histidine N-alpha-methyltransferase